MLHEQNFGASVSPEKRGDPDTNLLIILGLLRAAERLAMSPEREDVIALRQVILAARERAAAAFEGL